MAGMSPPRPRPALTQSGTPSYLSIFLLLTTLSLQVLGVSAESQEVLSGARTAARGWALGEAVPVECLNRTIETGEHITNEAGEFQYIPFWKCNETGQALEVSFGSEKDVNCTIAEVDDPLFHILEFYVHNDAPLSCRVPSLPPSAQGDSLAPTEYIHLQFAITGALQLSHLHINPHLNIILHTKSPDPTKSSSSPSSSKATQDKDKDKKKGGREPAARDNRKGAPEGQILAGTAYSLPPTSNSPKLVIGDPLPLTLSVRWYSTSVLPPSTSRLNSGLGGHVHLSTAAYCLLSFGAGLAVSLAYFRGVEMPQRLRRYGAEKLGGGGEGRGGYGYAYVPGSFPTYAANGKRD